ncbi:Arc family DNA-binding protein [Pseudomonas sp. FP2335]|uniref:Arc family DNA-binding protein n=1 Tax=Pseudomonas sp. FP2335 TaxID=2954092 RepID=UPI002733404D|nr:Arc family DNA-binding protein [Pseudomonas sp. FP2335]WLH76823.1 Arc family DNA-binding protein [Pseudomonas sp. FP2335]
MEEIYRSQFRLPYSLYEQLKASADKNRRSVNAELIARLEQSLEVQQQDAEDSPRFKIDGDAFNLGKYEPGADAVKFAGGPAAEKENSFMASLLELINEYRPAELKTLPPDNAKPKPNTGPEPRKRYPKK